MTEQRLIRGERPQDGDLRAALIAAYGSDFGVRDITWLSRFTDAARQASCYRKGRVLLAGDAAHVHSPVGGQGLNIGIQDAVNLGWKLAQVVGGVSADTLLDTYHAERHPVGADVLRQTLAVTALQRGDDRSNALRRLMAETMAMDGPRRWYVARISGLDIRYDIGDGHPLLGRRMPDVDITVAQRPLCVFELLRDARPVLLNFGTPGSMSIAGWADRITLIDATSDGRCQLPVIGSVSLPTAILIRPDGHVAWVGDESADGLSDKLAFWFGAREAAVRCDYASESGR